MLQRAQKSCPSVCWGCTLCSESLDHSFPAAGGSTSRELMVSLSSCEQPWRWKLHGLYCRVKTQHCEAWSWGKVLIPRNCSTPTTFHFPYSQPEVWLQWFSPHHAGGHLELTLWAECLTLSLPYGSALRVFFVSFYKIGSSNRGHGVLENQTSVY